METLEFQSEQPDFSELDFCSEPLDDSGHVSMNGLQVWLVSALHKVVPGSQEHYDVLKEALRLLPNAQIDTAADVSAAIVICEWFIPNLAEFPMAQKVVYYLLHRLKVEATIMDVAESNERICAFINHN